MSQTYTDKVKETAEKIDELLSALAKLREDIQDNRNRTVEASNKADGAEAAIKEITQAVVMHEVAIRKLYVGYTGQSILADALIRYLCGYEAGDYRKEVERAADSDTEVSLADMEIKDKNFDINRLQALAKEISAVRGEEAEKERKKQELRTSTIVAPNGKPVLKVVK